MICLNCRAANKSRAKFCEKCGASLGVTCAKCAHVNPATAQFCEKCGTPLGEITAEGQAPQSATQPQQPKVTIAQNVGKRRGFQPALLLLLLVLILPAGCLLMLFGQVETPAFTKPLIGAVCEQAKQLLPNLDCQKQPGGMEKIGDIPSTDQDASVPTREQAPAVQASDKQIPLIWDDDGSPDGIIALLYFFSHPKVNVLAATISYGEAHPMRFASYLSTMLDSLDHADIPVGAGRDSPIEGNNAFPDSLRNPTDDFWGVQLAEVVVQSTHPSAAQLIVDTIRLSEQPVTLFVSGSFTNIAEAIRLDPTIISKIRSIECMGGAIYDPGNVGGVWDFGIDNQFAEWNIYVDPYAAAEVFATGIEIHLTPLDATNRVWSTREDQIKISGFGNPTSQLAADLLNWKLDFQNSDRFTVFDLLAAVNTTDPQVCEWQDLALNVETRQGPELGRTFIVESADTPTKVCLVPDEEAVRDIIMEVFAQ